jgi:SAM-dependent methyltransferase
MDAQFRPVFEAATRPYRAAGRYTWNLAKGKLRLDPVFHALLRRGLLPDGGSLVDLGCGQGVLLSLLKAARDQYAAGRWPADWPAPPMHLDLRGVDEHAGRVQVARRVLNGGAQVEVSDLRKFDFPPSSVIVMLDVLLYLHEAHQERVMEKAAAALRPGGLLLLREPDADAGFALQLTKLSARFEAALRGKLAQPLHCRSAARWVADLSRRGFAVDAAPMSQGTPFCNVLFVARKVV